MKKILKLLLVISMLMISNGLYAQLDSTWNSKPTLNIIGFADVFYVYDFNKPLGKNRQAFFFNHNRHNEFNLNLALVKLELKHAKYRANIAIQTGTYSNDNYAAEPGLLKNIFEANIGLSLNKKNNLWLDAGVLPSHIGFESALSTDNLTLTRSLLAENSPYFLAGAKITYLPNDQWTLSCLIVNGWQRIQRLPGNSLPSFGTQINYKPNERLTLNWSTFIGTDDPDSTRRMRYFNNWYAQIQFHKKINIITGFDFGFQQSSSGSLVYNTWFSPVFIGQYSINNAWKIAVRAEYYQDKKEIIIPTSTLNGFQTTGLSFNIDYSPIQNIKCRLEGRWLHSKDLIFERNTSKSNNNFVLGTSLALKFSENFNKKL